jgi:Cupin-like domain
MHNVTFGNFTWSANTQTELLPEDRAWIAENLLRGGEPTAMAQRLIQDGRPGELVRREIAIALAHPYLKGAMRARELWTRRVAKANWTLDALAKLDSQNQASKLIPTVERISTADFYNAYYLENRPVVITGRLDDWPAMTKWSLDYFVDQWGEAIVEVQAGREGGHDFETDAGRYARHMRFAEFVATIRTAHTNDCYMTARNSDGNRAGLAGLWDDIGDLPDYLAPTQPRSGFFWLGPAGTITPTHHDLTNNFMAQVVGRKRVMLVNAVYQPHMYNYLHVFSRVDLSAVDRTRFPDTAAVNVLECVLEPGQILFLPVGWWHHVEGLDLSVTMTFTNFRLDNGFSSFYRASGEL